MSAKAFPLSSVAIKRRGVILALMLALLTGCDSVEVSPPAPLTDNADRILVRKAERRMTLFRGDRELRTYRVALGGSPVGDKKCQGDEKTPEGVYRIVGRNPNSIAHRSLMISYPNGEDRREAAELRCDPGGDITIHGYYNAWKKVPEVVRKRLHANDWTWGCIAVTDAEIEKIWDAVPNGTPIEIRP